MELQLSNNLVILMIQCIHEFMHSQMYSLFRHLAVRWLQVAVDCYSPIRLVAVTLLPNKDVKSNGMGMLIIPLNIIRSKCGLLCSPEHSKICFLLHETPFAVHNSLFCRGLWLNSKVSQLVHTYNWY